MEDLIHAFGIDWHLLLAQGVNFIILLVILTYFLYGPLMRVLKERADKIAQGVKDAEAAGAERAAVAAERGGIIAEANHEGSLVLARAEEEAKAKRAEIVHAAEARAEAILRDAESAAAEAERLAIKAAESEIAKNAILAAEKILSK